MLSAVDTAQNRILRVAILHRDDQLIVQAVSLRGWLHLEEYELQQNLANVPSESHRKGTGQFRADRCRIVLALEVADVLSRLVVTSQLDCKTSLQIGLVTMYIKSYNSIAGLVTY